MRQIGAIVGAAMRALRLAQTGGRVASSVGKFAAPQATGSTSMPATTLNPNYIWSYRLSLSPYDRLVEVLEAFFASYPGGDYTCEHRDRFKLRFRRGKWRKSILRLGDLVPDALVRGQFNQWPIVVRVLVRPSPEAFDVSIHYELYLPNSTPKLGDAVQSSVDQHARRELDDLAGYLAECIGLDAPPEVAGADQ